MASNLIGTALHRQVWEDLEGGGSQPQRCATLSLHCGHGPGPSLAADRHVLVGFAAAFLGTTVVRRRGKGTRFLQMTMEGGPFCWRMYCMI